MTTQFFMASRTLIPSIESATGTFNVNATTLDAATEALHYSGQVYLEAGSGSKTISSAGGKIHWRTAGTITFANASTNLRIGLQDLSTTTAPTQGDGTHDVYADLVGGTDTLAGSTAYATAMETGTKTLAHGDKVAIVWEMTARGGTDSVQVTYATGGQLADVNFPTTASYLASTWAKVNGTPLAMLEFDDGTYGMIFGGLMASTTGASQAFASNTGTADEYGNTFSFPFPVVVDGFWAMATPSSNAADFEVCLYSDPLGTPTLIEAVTVDATQIGTTSVRNLSFMFASPRTFNQNTVYGLTVRPTTTTNVGVYYHDAPVGGMKMAALSTNCYAIRRLDNAGAFSDWNGGTAKTRRMTMGLIVRAFEDVWGEARAQSMIGI